MMAHAAYPPGACVVHQKFGHGVVLETDGSTFVSVQFASGDIKWLDTRIAPMRLAGDGDEKPVFPTEKTPRRAERSPTEAITPETLDHAVSCWEKAVEHINRGWDCIDEYRHDLFAKELLEEEVTAYLAQADALPEALQERIRLVDERFRYVTMASHHCVWPGDPDYCNTDTYWYYYRWPLDSVVADVESLSQRQTNQ